MRRCLPLLRFDAILRYDARRGVTTTIVEAVFALLRASRAVYTMTVDAAIRDYALLRRYIMLMFYDVASASESPRYH